ncbi:tellurite resistance/C4-dicarboxylate transporter family protein [Streptomyces chiangmaiensis]|uniref:Tellurite resistance/C4-dicarboxylate transporter family protein n=1 Tax=Streptomyces chiangmaiensis TaxID=766497 RepID=A0ABU7FD87_9ACTN|nr:tellurite resistance/C4-dicarboxylate transporter family protein [Streptomyces chiangmaiensis]MED7822137.1 tellurite resistance/C4-dicarboxylate transporter family protein [Streptomyces chiangmaiensis]
MSGTSALRTWWSQRPPATGAAVMATGILSVGLRLTGYQVLSRIALALTAAAWLGLVADVAVRVLRERERWVDAALPPTALTPVAATATLGTAVSALSGQSLAEALLALTALLWAGLVLGVVPRWTRRMPGTVFLGCVATEGIAVLGAVLAAAAGVAWLAHTALVFFWLGLVFYLVGLRCFDLRQVATGAGDHWIVGGGLAISAVAGARLVIASHRMYLWNNDDSAALRGMTIALLALALLCYCVLAAAEVIRPRLGHDVRRWATVFPMGMTAVAALSVATAIGGSWLPDLGRVLLWIAVAAWCALLVAAVSSALGGVRSRAPR